MIEYKRISKAILEAPIRDPDNANIIPMSTLVGIDANPPNHAWLLETTWDGRMIGDVHIFRNLNANPSLGSQLKDSKGIPKEPEWVWWGGIPCGKVLSYSFAKSETATMVPHTEAMHFEVDAQREEKPRTTSKGSGQARSGAIPQP